MNYKPKTASEPKKENITQLRRQIKELNAKLQDLDNEKQRLIPNISEEELISLLNDLPITTLRQSLDHSNGVFKPIFSMKTMTRFNEISKEREKIVDEIDITSNKLSTLRIERVLKKIKKIT